MSRIFLIEQPEPAKSTGWMPDLTSAQKYGTLVPIFTRSDRPTIRPQQAIEKAKLALRDFREDDYVLWATGDPCGLFIVSSILAQKGFTRVSYLRWERTRNAYGERDGSGLYVPLIIDTKTQ